MKLKNPEFLLPFFWYYGNKARMRNIFNRLLARVTPRIPALPDPYQGDQRALAAFQQAKSAEYGARCRTVAFLNISGDREWYAGRQDTDSGTWYVTKYTAAQNLSGSAAKIGEPVISKKTLFRNIPFIEAIAQLATYEQGQNALGYLPADEVTDDHYIPFAEREGIVFDTDGMPHPTLHGEIITDGSFTPATIERAKSALTKEVRAYTAKALLDTHMAASQSQARGYYNGLPDFLEALKKLAHDPFLSYSFDEPCRLSHDIMADNMDSRLAFSGDKVLQRCVSPVEEFLTAAPGPVRSSFQDLFNALKTAENRIIRNGNRVSPGEISAEETEKAQSALDAIWLAIPEIDPRVMDGYDYVMNDEKLIDEVLPRHSFGKRSFREVADYKLDDKLQKIADGTVSVTDAEKIRAAAIQYLENMQALKPFGRDIASMAVITYLLLIYEDKVVYGYDNPLRFIAQRNLAAAVLRNPKEWAERIQSGQHHPLLPGSMHNGKEEDHKITRNAAQTRAAQASHYLAFCADICSGQWFDRRHAEIAALLDAAQPKPALPAPKQVPALSI